MKFIKIACASIFLFTLAYVIYDKKTIPDISEICPEYKLMVEYSKKIKPQTGLVLYSYGINSGLPKSYVYKNGVANFTMSYVRYMTRQDSASIDEARRLLVSVSEGLLKEINSNELVVSGLDTYPLNSDLIKVVLYFQDEKKIDLGQGVAQVHFSRGKIRYEAYNIEEYTGKYPAVGKHYTILEESYAEALEIVKGQGNLIPL